jgi:hypothetical protein
VSLVFQALLPLAAEFILLDAGVPYSQELFIPLVYQEPLPVSKFSRYGNELMIEELTIMLVAVSFCL